MDVDGSIDFHKDGGQPCRSFYGHFQLAAGKTGQDAHNEFKQALPRRKLETRWLDLDAVEWDEIIADPGVGR